MTGKKVYGSFEEPVGEKKCKYNIWFKNIYLDFVSMKDYKKKIISNENML